MSRANPNIDSLLNVVKHTQDDSVFIFANSKLADIYSRHQNDTANYFAERAMVRAKKTKVLSYLFEATIAKVRCFYIVHRNYQGALGVIQEALTLFSGTSNSSKKSILKAYRSYMRALDFMERGFFPEAQNDLYQGIKLFKEGGDFLGQLACYNKLGVLNGQQGQNEEAIKVFNEAIPIARESGRVFMYNALTLNKAVILETQKKYKECLSIFREAKVINRSLQPGNFNIQSTISHNMSGIHYQLGQMDSAYYYGKLGYEQVKEIDNSLIKIESLGPLCNACVALKKTGEAQKYCGQLYSSLEHITSLQVKSKMTEVLRGYYISNGNYKQAVAILENLINLNEELFNSTKIKEQTEQRKDFEFEKERLIKEQELTQKNAEIAASKERAMYLTIGLLALFIFIVSVLYLLKKNIANKRIIESKNGELQAGLAHKEILLKEIHHRVKNNLQMVINLLELQINKVDDDNTISILGEGRDRVFSMALIHQHLYGEMNLARINLFKYLNQLTSQLSKTYLGEEPCKITLENTDIELDIDTAIPLGLIVNELVTNSFKYGRVQGQKFELTLELMMHASGEYQMRVKDNGPGLPEFFDIEKAKSLGLRLVRRLSSQLRGRAIVEVAQGACLSIYFLDSIGRKQFE